MAEISKQALQVANNTDFPDNNSGAITPSVLRSYNVDVIDSTVNQTVYTTDSGSFKSSITQLNSFTASQQPSFTALNAFTASQLTINSGVNAATHSLSASIAVVSSEVDVLQTWSSSVNQIIEDNVSKGYATRFNFGGLISASITPNVNGPIADITVNADPSAATTQSFNQFTQSINAFTQSTNIFTQSINTYTASLKNAISVSGTDASILGNLNVSGTISAYEIHTIIESSSVIFSSGSNVLGDAAGDIQTLNGTVNLPNGNLNVTGSITVSGLVDGVDVSQFYTITNAYTASNNTKWDTIGALTGSYATTSSVNNLNAFTASADAKFTTIGTQSGSWVLESETGSFAITGSNVFIGDETFADASGNTVALQSYSGSLFLTAKSIASGSSTLAHVTSSTNQVNLIFKGSSATGETVISGSNNFIANQGATTAGFRKLITNGNIGLVGTTLPQFSSSMAFSPTVSSNYFANTNTFAMTVRGPVSSSAYSITNNGIFGGTINLGTAGATNYERAINGTTIGNNIVNGTVNVTAYKTAFTNTSAMTIASNNIGGTVSLNADSSSITLAASTIQSAALTVNNSYYNVSGTGGGNSLQISQGNAIFGNNILLYASGSNTTAGTGRQFNANLLAGTFNSASVNLSGDTSNMFSTAIVGHNLSVTGSSAIQTGAPIRSNTYGSAFFGRHNAQDGNRAKTGETVFAVGTGTTTTPKTGFLIDSGSNTFVEGSLTVTGSIKGNVVSASIVSSTASIDLNQGTYFTLTLDAGTTTNINVINPSAGETAILKVITSGASATASFSSNVYQPSGSRYVPTNTGTDIITFAAWDSTNVYATAIVNMQ